MKKFVIYSLFLITFSLSVWFLLGDKVSGFYADMVLNSKAEKRGMPPVIFPHWIHRLEFKCKVC
ncbi:MAG: hypothetical protein AAB244_00765, partial [Nitrospirota bacterium]